MTRPDFEENWRRRFTERGLMLDDDAGIAGWTPSGLETRMRNFQRLWPGAPAGSRWFDIGCGAGSYSRLLAEEGLRVIALDYSLPSVAKARARSPGIEAWCAADINRLPFPPASADGILCFGVLQALASPEQALLEMSTLLRPGGTLWVDALNAHALPQIARRVLHRRASLRYDTATQLCARLRALGLKPEVHWIPIAPSRLYRLQPALEFAPVRALLHRVPALGSMLSHSILITARKPATTNAPTSP